MAFSSLDQHAHCGSFTQNPWYLVRCKPCQEDRAFGNISNLGAEALLPQFLPAKSTQPRPFFPGYLFSAFPLELFTQINNAYGVRKIVCFGIMPAVVPLEVINGLRSRMNSRGVIDMPEEFAPVRFKAGDKVMITGGPLRNFVGIFDCDLSGNDRVRILLDTVGSFSDGWRTETRGSAIKVDVGRRDLMHV